MKLLDNKHDRMRWRVSNNFQSNLRRRKFRYRCPGTSMVPETSSLKCQLDCVNDDSTCIPDSLFQCAQNGNVKEVIRIIKSDPTRLHARNPQGQMPLHVAVMKGHMDIVELMVNEKAGKCLIYVYVMDLMVNYKAGVCVCVSMYRYLLQNSW